MSQKRGEGERVSARSERVSARSERLHAREGQVDGGRGKTGIVGKRAVWRELGRVVFCEWGVGCVEAPPGNTTSILNREAIQSNLCGYS